MDKNLTTILESFRNTHNLDGLEALITDLADGDPQLWGDDELHSTLHRAIAERTGSMEHLTALVFRMIERYDALCRKELESLAGMFSWPELFFLLNANPRNSTAIDSIDELQNWALDPSEETPWEEDPGLPLAKKLVRLTFTQKLALCDVMERIYRRGTSGYNPESLDFFGLRLAEASAESIATA